MKSMDWQDAENFRNHIIAEIFEFAQAHGLSAEASETELVLQLPSVDEINVWPEHKKRAAFNWDNIPSNGIIEGMPDEFPPTTTPLDEGEPPKGDDEV